VENVLGKAYLNVISTLDEETEVQVPTLRLKPLDELFDNRQSNLRHKVIKEKLQRHNLVSYIQGTIKSIKKYFTTMRI